MTYLKPSDYDLINSLDIKDLNIFYEAMSVCCMVEDMLKRHDKEQIKEVNNMSCKKRKPRK